MFDKSNHENYQRRERKGRKRMEKCEEISQINGKLERKLGKKNCNPVFLSFCKVILQN